MGLPKGRTNNPAGKPKGAVNATTKQVRELFAAFLERNMHKIDGLFDEMVAENPKHAFDALMTVTKRFVPEVQAVQFNDEDGNPTNPPVPFVVIQKQNDE